MPTTSWHAAQMCNKSVMGQCLECYATVQAAGRSVPALQSLHLGAEQMQDLMPGRPASKKSSKPKADARPAIVLPPTLDDNEPFVPPLAALKRYTPLPLVVSPLACRGCSQHAGVDYLRVPMLTIVIICFGAGL